MASLLKEIYGISYKTLCGEAGDINSASLDEWKIKLCEICKNFNVKDNFNVDEIGLFFKQLSTKTLAQKSDFCRGEAS